MTGDGTEPTATELDAIEAEWPLIEAQLDVLDAQIIMLAAGGPVLMDWRRLRRAQRGVLAARRAVSPRRPARSPGVAS
jgi:hypothetical protein